MHPKPLCCRKSRRRFSADHSDFRHLARAVILVSYLFLVSYIF
jgi:hypothetical protein